MTTDTSQPVAAVLADLISDASTMATRAAAADSLNTQLASDKAALLATTSSQSIVIAALQGQVASLQQEVATLEAQIGAGTPTPTPAPAPAFTVQPSIDGTAQIGQVLTGMDGTITGGTAVSRRWLLGAAVVSTAQTYLATAAGALVYEVTAQGPGGTTVASSAAATVVPAPVSALRPLGPVGTNLGTGGYATATFLFMDRMKSSGTSVPGGFWANSDTAAQNVAPLNADKYPTDTTLPSYTLVNVDGPYMPGVLQHYVVETNKLDCDITINSAGTISNTVVNGKRRVVVDASSTDQSNGGYFFNLTVHPATPFVAGQDTITCYRLDQEAAGKAGAIFLPECIARLKSFASLRDMDFAGTNAAAFKLLADRPQLSWSSWNTVPLEAFISLCNACGTDAEINIPFGAEDALVSWMGAYVQANLLPTLRAMPEDGNEVWNNSFPVFQQAFSANTPAAGLATNPNWPNQGYLAARAVMLFAKATGWSSRVRGHLASQDGYAAVLDGNIAGAKLAITEWCNPAHANYDADAAAHMPVFGQVFPYIGHATYFDGNLSFAPKATLLQWAAATDDTGLAAAFRQLEFGDVVPDPHGTSLATLPHHYDYLMQVADREQVATIAYEGGLGLVALAAVPDLTGDDVKGMTTDQANAAVAANSADQATVTAFFQRVLLDPRMQAIEAKRLTIQRAAGFSLNTQFSDCGLVTKYGIWGALTDGYHTDTPRNRALMAFAANPPAPPALAITATPGGDAHVGGKPVTALHITGGVGRKEIVVTGLPAGRAYDGFRGIAGTYTTQETITWTATVTDEAEAQASVPITETVGPAQVGYRYFRLTPGNLKYGGGPGDGFYQPTSSSCRPLVGSTPINVQSWTVSQTYPGGSRPGYLLSNLLDGDPTTVWQPINAGQPSGSIAFDAGEGNLYKPTAFAIGNWADNDNLSISTMALVEVSIDGTTWVQVASNVTLHYVPDTGGAANAATALCPLAYPS